MTAPEKIYLQVCGECPEEDCKDCKFEDLEDNVTWCKDRIYKKDIEYIRKDALLEWLENKIKVPDVGFINGLTYLAYKDVIEHLNEM